MSELSELAEAIGASERTLRRAVSQGAVRARRPTPRKLEVPLAERRYLRRFWRLLFDLRQALRTEKNVRFALLVGSVARGTATSRSDVDVLVELEDPAIDRLIDLAEKLSAALGRPVDLLRVQDIESEPGFLADLIADGRVLVDRDGIWPRLKGREQRIRKQALTDRHTEVDTALAGIDRLLAG